VPFQDTADCAPAQAKIDNVVCRLHIPPAAIAASCTISTARTRKRTQLGGNVSKTIAPHLPGDGQLAGRPSRRGTVAPDFQMRDEQGNFVTLRRLIRQRPLLLYLYRGSW
jgi:hypothetical protein